MNKRMVWLLVMGLVAVLVAAGCGDDDDEEPTAQAALSKEEYIQQADQVCQEGDAEIDQAVQETFAGGRPSPQEEEQFATDTVIPNIQGQIDDLRALPPPEGDEEAVARIYDSAQQGLDEAEQDPSVFTSEGRGENPLAEATRLAKDYGFQNCGQGG